ANSSPTSDCRQAFLGNSDLPSLGYASSSASTRSSGLFTSPAFFFTGTSRVPVTRVSRAAFIQASTRVRYGSCSLDLVLKIRSPISGSILSPVSRSSTRCGAAPSPIRPVWVSLRPSPSQVMNERIWPVSLALSAAATKSFTLRPFVCSNWQSSPASQARRDRADAVLAGVGTVRLGGDDVVELSGHGLPPRGRLSRMADG